MAALPEAETLGSMPSVTVDDAVAVEPLGPVRVVEIVPGPVTFWGLPWFGSTTGFTEPEKARGVSVVADDCDDTPINNVMLAMISR